MSYDKDTSVTFLEGTGTKTYNKLVANGFETFGDVASATTDELEAVDGIGRKLANKFITDARSKLDGSVRDTLQDAETGDDIVMTVVADDGSHRINGTVIETDSEPPEYIAEDGVYLAGSLAVNIEADVEHVQNGELPSEHLSIYINEPRPGEFDSVNAEVWSPITETTTEERGGETVTVETILDDDFQILTITHAELVETDGGTPDDDDERFDRSATIEAVRLPVGSGDVGYTFSTGASIESAVEISGWSRPVVELVEERAPLSQFDHLPETPRRLADRDPDETYRVTVATVLIDTSLDPDDSESFEIHFSDDVELVETDGGTDVETADDDDFDIVTAVIETADEFEEHYDGLAGKFSGSAGLHTFYDSSDDNQPLLAFDTAIHIAFDEALEELHMGDRYIFDQYGRIDSDVVEHELRKQLIEYAGIPESYFLDRLVDETMRYLTETASLDETDVEFDDISGGDE